MIEAVESGDSSSSQVELTSGCSREYSNVKEWICARHVLAFMGFLGFANVYAMRVNLSVAIVAMVNSSAIPQKNYSIDDTCPVNVNASSNSSQDGEFLWDEATQGIILGSFFWGYVITNPIGGRLGDVLGGKRVFGFGIFITSLLTLLTPLASNISPYLLTALRICIGLGEGIEIGAGISISERGWACIKSHASASLFVKDLAALIWDESVIREKSVTGRKCPTVNGDAKPPLTPQKVEVINDTLRKVLRERGVDSSAIEKEIKSVNRYLRRKSMISKENSRSTVVQP